MVIIVKGRREWKKREIAKVIVGDKFVQGL